jgi:hypothetical protein
VQRFGQGAMPMGRSVTPVQVLVNQSGTDYTLVVYRLLTVDRAS